MTFSVDTDLNRILELINDNIIESSNFINDSNLTSKYLNTDTAMTSNLGTVKNNYDIEQILLIEQKDANNVKDEFSNLVSVQGTATNLSNLNVDDNGLIYAENNDKKLYDLRHFIGYSNYDTSNFDNDTDILKITQEPVKSDYSDNYLRFQLFKELEQKSDNEITTTTTTTITNILNKYMVDSSNYRNNTIDDLITLIEDIKDNYGVKLKFFIECAKHYYHINLLLKSNKFIENIFVSNIAGITFTGADTIDVAKQRKLFTFLQNKINNLKLKTETISSEYEQTIQSNIYDKLDNIKNINKNLMNRQDTTKSKNDEFKKLLDNTFYNNIFLYITILILIICCFTVIGIEVNNKNNNSLIVILAFLIFYYIIYNSFNKIENFYVDQGDVEDKIKEYHKKVMSYLYKRANALPNINDAILREENKYSSYDLMSKSHLNKLNISLNDEFLQYLKNKELINFLILVTIIGILCYQIYKKLDDITIPTIVGVILLLIITTVYFYNISLNTHSKYESKYWNHRYPMKK